MDLVTTLSAALALVTALAIAIALGLLAARIFRRGKMFPDPGGITVWPERDARTTPARPKQQHGPRPVLRQLRAVATRHLRELGCSVKWGRYQRFLDAAMRGGSGGTARLKARLAVKYAIYDSSTATWSLRLSRRRGDVSGYLIYLVSEDQQLPALYQFLVPAKLMRVVTTWDHERADEWLRRWPVDRTLSILLTNTHQLRQAS